MFSNERSLPYLTKVEPVTTAAMPGSILICLLSSLG